MTPGGSRAPPQGDLEPGSGVYSTGVTPLLNKMGVNEDQGCGEDYNGFKVASPFNSRRSGALQFGGGGGGAARGKYLEDEFAGEARGMGRADARRGGKGGGGGVARPLRMWAITWNLAGKLPPASIAGIYLCMCVSVCVSTGSERTYSFWTWV